MNGYPRFGWVDILRFQQDELDKAAVQQIQQAFGASYEVELIDCDMTQILENSDVNTNSGGGLNCLTWTLFSAE